ncbi:hypothetical protein JCM11491_004939 [Sporobolomyces phaffii]
MRASPSVSLTKSWVCLARRPTSFNPRKDPLDLANTVGPDAAPFDFPLTRPTVLKLEKQRQLLHYLRLEHLQFKDLVAFRQAFVPPDAARQVVQVRHQHYQGEAHPAARKVSIEVRVDALGLAPAARHKFKVVAGPRYDPASDTFKLACERYPSDTMNEKWCSDTLDKLVAAATDATQDAFADVELDLRGPATRALKSRKAKKTLGLKDFPQEWLRPSTST